MCRNILAFLGWSSFDSQCLEIIRGRDPGVATATANQRAKKNFPFISRAHFSLSHLNTSPLVPSLFEFLCLSETLSHSSLAEQIMYAATRRNTGKGIHIYESAKSPSATHASLETTRPYCNRECEQTHRHCTLIHSPFSLYGQRFSMHLT